MLQTGDTVMNRMALWQSWGLNQDVFHLFCFHFQEHMVRGQGAAAVLFLQESNKI